MIATDYSTRELLEQAGSRIRERNRADCPKCKGYRTVSFNERKGVYFCHHAGCDFSGTAEKLAYELGLAQRFTPAERQERNQNRKRADRAAHALYQQVQARRFELLDRLHTLCEMESTAHGSGPDNPQGWDAFRAVYAERPVILAELSVLENALVRDLLVLFSNPQEHANMIDRVIVHGGLFDSEDKFVEVLV